MSSGGIGKGDRVMVQTRDKWCGQDQYGLMSEVVEVHVYPPEHVAAVGARVIFGVKMPGGLIRPLIETELAYVMPQRKDGSTFWPCSCCSTPLPKATRYCPDKGKRLCPKCDTADCSEAGEDDPPCGHKWSELARANRERFTRSHPVQEALFEEVS